ncbi:MULTISPECIES: response regulator transcription factor [unclassified Enterococcus]|uniref:response regulator transcription factor n=1 Tax=unclassified Enterococcus TaxID=2608891 RepID=UPI00155746DC|nr:MULTISPECIES: response regulator transcription factor [unclassified Enterococcus]MBS7577514.1 response regulator transcription factor [Enterococcus sp. MMGLQ5-2]MBS7584987.1 response regulator transcription factor [Enterococcus sp. MMGLQ5-1]NPD12842.1 response regulator transcription factor [Enterococcus sp. MMGLQ5-1]NPD37347.1 response regulator transcription factor [Enterococcus sp. MMGLQ5-2]
MKINLLVVDDDATIRKGIRIYLEQEGYQVTEAKNGVEALAKLQEQEFHLIILDVMMPQLDGNLTSIKIRSAGNNIPILMLSAKSEAVDKIQGLTVGADDYLTKPFSPMELIARVKSLLRRFIDLGEYENKQKSDLLIVDGLVLDQNGKTVTIDERPIKMTPKEFAITELLMKNAGKVFSIDEIYELVWQEPSFNADNTVSVHIRKIREKIEINPKKPKYLKVVWGVGYKIEKI